MLNKLLRCGTLLFFTVFATANPSELSTKFHVVGAGLGRTGTMSLKHALDRLGFGKIFHMQDSAKSPYLGPLWKELADLSPLPISQEYYADERTRSVPQWPPQITTQSKYQGRRVELLQTILGLNQSYWEEQGQDHYLYHSAVDFPTCMYFRDMIDAYGAPNVKVILTKRETGLKWAKSAIDTILISHPSRSQWNMKLLFFLPSMNQIDQMLWNTFYRHFPHVLVDEDEALLASYHDSWNEHVRTTLIKYSETYSMPLEDILLEYQVKEGWEPLCNFLQVQNCPKDEPFPKVNDKEKFKERLRYFSIIGYGFAAFLLACVAFVLLVILKGYSSVTDVKQKSL